MKKISEIGEKMYRNLYTTDFYDQGWFDEALDSERRDTEEMYVYTEKERRELIAQSIYAFILSKIESYLAKDSLGNCMKEVFKEQGL
ncbi:MAG: hypothetical protein E6Q97_00900 [Desulfurellales bacterium]|nr:MAG: hypothetical protein E6Q97_00900 [Desulfurellales bacterium]